MAFIELLHTTVVAEFSFLIESLIVLGNIGPVDLDSIQRNLMGVILQHFNYGLKNIWSYIIS